MRTYTNSVNASEQNESPNTSQIHASTVLAPSPLFFIYHQRSFLRISCFIVLIALLLVAHGCYSFTGSSVPAHLKTLQIPLVEDNSPITQGQFRDLLTQQLIQNFRRENAFKLVEDQADAVLLATIANIGEETANVQAGELERDKKVVVTVNVVCEDRVKLKNFIQKSFSATITYEVSGGVQARNTALQRAFQQVANDIVLGVVSGW
ncbi:MAG: hypothetical protein EAZ92_02060 [Candidatus Kapaibacterium sp.]|nr:MAG: hypothetical protein EAZ92_02060 [Candidatus Kapabacteria bacterium]